MGLNELLQAYLIAQGSHTGGHFIQAQNPDDPMDDVPISLDLKNLTEKWRTPDNRTAADIHGAGFGFQDTIRNLIPDEETRNNVGEMSALIKGLYLAGVPMKLSKQMKSGGDIEALERTSGNRYVKPLVGISALADLYDIPIKFTTVNGAPGLMYSMRF